MTAQVARTFSFARVLTLVVVTTGAVVSPHLTRAVGPMDVHLNPNPKNIVTVPSTGNTFSIEITGVTSNVTQYSVVAQYDQTVISVTAVANTTSLTTCPGDTPIYGGGADGVTQFAFESTCGHGSISGPTLQLFAVRFDCLKLGSSPITFDSLPGITGVNIESNGAALTVTATNGVVNCLPSGCSGDVDCDGMPDSYEAAHTCLDSATYDGNTDTDGDGLPSFGEYQRGTDPCNPDSDGDRCRDGIEVANQGVKKPDNPLDATDFPDVDGSGKVAVGDFSLLLAHWNTTPSSRAWWAPIDLDHGGKVEVHDFSILLKAWNRTCS
jgi:hypothetical protein